MHQDKDKHANTKPEMDPERLLESYRYCYALTKKHAKNFYYGFLISTPRLQFALSAIYAWMRILDDIVDGPGTNSSKLKIAQQFYLDTLRVLSHDFLTSENPPKEPFWLAFRQTVIDYQIPFCHFQNMYEGQLQDLNNKQYHCFEELYHYCYCVASTVGLICIKIWGYTGGETTEKLAEWRGIAFQLTNILRDINLDHRRGRNYLPGIPTDKQQKTSAIQALMVKTKHYYELSKDLEKHIDKNGIFCLKIITHIYYKIFVKMRNRPLYHTEDKVIKLSFIHKLLIAARTIVLKSAPISL